MCNCIDEMNEKLKPLNGEIGVTFAFPRDGTPSCMLPTIRVEKIQTRSRTRPPLAIPTFCPFCGVRYQPETVEAA